MHACIYTRIDADSYIGAYIYMYVYNTFMHTQCVCICVYVWENVCRPMYVTILHILASNKVYLASAELERCCERLSRYIIVMYNVCILYYNNMHTYVPSVA